MKKIRDRFWLGIIAGLGGNISKIAVERFFNRIGFSKSNGWTTAAGIFLKDSDISTPYGRMVGFVADGMIAVMLGVTCSYWLTLMGKDRYLLKGAGLGAAEWTALYGVTSKLGATAIFPVKPKDALATFASHLAFGMTKITITAKLGDENLFGAVLTEGTEKRQNLSVKDSASKVTVITKPERSSRRKYYFKRYHTASRQSKA